jgi:hypothetical protein
VKRRLAGNIISSGDRTFEHMKRARTMAANTLHNSTHGGERLRVFEAPMPRGGDGPRLPGDCDMETLDAFVKERKKHVKNLRVGKVPDDVLELWRAAADSDAISDEMDYFQLEQLAQHLQKHTVELTLYSVVLEKCPDDSRADCTWCRSHPRRGSFSFRHLRANKFCSADEPCPDPRFCKHAIFQKIDKIHNELAAATPANLRPPRRCGICRAEGHDRRGCPQRPQEAAAADDEDLSLDAE